MYNNIALGVKPPADLVLYCDDKIAYGHFDKTEVTDELIRVKGEDLPMVNNVTVAVFAGEKKLEFLFKDIFKQKIKITAPDAKYTIAVVEFPVIVIVDKNKVIDQLNRYLILQKEGDYFTAPLVMPGLKPRLQKTLIAQLLDKTVFVMFYEKHDFHKLSKKDYLSAPD